MKEEETGRGILRMLMKWIELSKVDPEEAVVAAYLKGYHDGLATASSSSIVDRRLEELAETKEVSK